MTTRLNQLRPALAALALAGAMGSAPALADGTPFYGFSGYYGGPTAYYTYDTDVQQATRLNGGQGDFGVRVYTPGGPFWTYKAHGRTGLPYRRRAGPIRARG